MSTVLHGLAGILLGFLNVAMLALYAAPLVTIIWIMRLIGREKISLLGNILYLLVTVEAVWWYAKGVFELPVPPALDIFGQIGAIILTVAIIVATIVNIGRDVNKKAPDEPGPDGKEKED